MFFIDMHNKFWSESADSHPNHIGIWDNSFNSTEKTQKSITWQDIVKISVSQQKDPFLLFIHMVYFDQFCRQDYLFYDAEIGTSWLQLLGYLFVLW